jgi:hypothetical protein
VSGTVQASGFAFTTVKTGAKPDCKPDLDQGRLKGHLTKGFDGATWKDDAITWKASVPTTLSAAERQSWEFGFVQIAEATQFQSFYAGRIPREGSITLDYFIPPALPKTIWLDEGDKFAELPWYRSPGATIIGNRMEASSGDHPGMIVPLTLENRVRSYVKNYLFHVIMDRRFWTVFTAKPPGEPVQYIAHIAWRLRYDFRFAWSQDKPSVARDASILDVPATGTVGRPTESVLQGLLNTPADPRANEAGNRAILVTDSGSPPNRLDLQDRFFNVPGDFWSKS